MKILLINCVYGQGSTGKILESLHKGLIKEGHDVEVLYSRGPAVHENGVHKILPEKVVKFQALMSRLTGYTYGCSPFTTSRIKKRITSYKPDVVNLHCINANTVNVAEIITFLKRNNIPTVVTAHAEFLYTGGCAHSMECNQWKSGCKACMQIRSKKSTLPASITKNRTAQYWEQLNKAYKNFSQLKATGVSPWLVSRMKQSPFFSENEVYCTMNGINTEIFHSRNSNKLREKLGLNPKARVFLHVTPNFEDPLKGGKFILEFAKKLQKEYPDDKVIIIGYNSSNKELPRNVIPIYHTNNQEELAEYYSLASATLLTSSRETFSMVTAESLCCGTPVVGFRAGGPESIATEGYVKFVEYGDCEALYKEAIHISKTSEISSAYIQIFSHDKMTKNYINVYSGLIKNERA